MVGDVILDDEVIHTPEAYHLSASAATDEITIVGNDAAGVMYGCQTLFSMMGSDANQIVPSGDVIDYPRFPYRGMHLDISRNFHGMDDITRLIHGMSMFKMNKLHLHLTDDEGWRLEIPGLPEITEVCHNVENVPCDTVYNYNIRLSRSLIPNLCPVRMNVLFLLVILVYNIVSSFSAHH